ncbi:MAG: hypothetical protein HY211_05090 [Candidatus Omnitrophica bacterium]|nr:hypothetical protein [Candidatus Omnitrophota bacterium]
MAAALVVILSVALTTVLGRGFKAWQKAQRRLERLFVIEKAFNRIGQDLRNGVALADRPFEGLNSELTFATGEGATRLAQIHYVIQFQGQTQALVRQRIPFPLEEQGAVEARTIASGVKDFFVEYGYPAATGDAHAQAVVKWAPTWNSAKQPLEVPKLVRVRIEMATPSEGVYSVTRQFLVSHGAMRQPPDE